VTTRAYLSFIVVMRLAAWGGELCVAGDDVDGVEYAAFNLGVAVFVEGDEEVGGFFLSGMKDESGVDCGGFFRAGCVACAQFPQDL
jgi:hypothetical protein